MTDLRAFLEARLAEDESVALAASGSTPRLQKVGFSAHWHTEPWYDGTGERCDLRAGVAGDLTAHGGIEVPAGEHAARHDPARVLREVAAKRALLAVHLTRAQREPDAPLHVKADSAYRDPACLGCGLDPIGLDMTGDIEECPVLLAVASVWSDHPDYLTEWGAA